MEQAKVKILERYPKTQFTEEKVCVPHKENKDRFFPKVKWTLLFV